MPDAFLVVRADVLAAVRRGAVVRVRVAAFGAAVSAFFAFTGLTAGSSCSIFRVVFAMNLLVSFRERAAGRGATAPGTPAGC